MFFYCNSTYTVSGHLNANKVTDEGLFRAAVTEVMVLRTLLLFCRHYAPQHVIING